ncbi:MAG: hypothetical protein WAQ33_15045 [Gaiellaceae bacterium]
MHELLDRHGIEYWLFGGWAVDFYAGSVTRPHDDVDIAVWLDDHARIADLLAAEGWKHAPEADEDGGTGYERGFVRLELTFLVRGEDGQPCIPLRDRLTRWPEEPLGDDVAEFDGVRARIVGLSVLKRSKSQAREDPADARKDRADSATLASRTFPLGAAAAPARLDQLRSRMT